MSVLFDILDDDVLSNIFSLLNPDSRYFIINKIIYDLRKQYLIIHLKNHLKINTKTNRENHISCLLYYYGDNLKDDIGHYRKHILHLLANKNKKMIIYPCVNSYHRMLVHNFCNSQGLLHETIEKGTKKRSTCKKCNSVNISITSDDYYYDCKDCKYCERCYADTKYYALDKLVTNLSLPQKVIKISKIHKEY